MARTMRKKTWTVIAVANDTRHLWSCLQKATDAHDAMRQCAAEMGTVDPSSFQIIGAIRGDHDVIASGEDGGPESGRRRPHPVGVPDRRWLALCRYRRTPRSDPRCFGG